MDEFKGIKVEFIQLSNKNIFDVLEKDLSKKLRFEDISIEAILGKYLCNNDIEIIVGMSYIPTIYQSRRLY